MPDNSNIYDLEDDVPLFVGAAFEKLAGGPVTVAKLAAEYKPPTKNNMAALVKQLRKDSGDKTVNQDSWKVHFITEVLQHARTDEGKTAFLRDNDNGKWRLADGVDLGAVTYGDQLLIRPPAAARPVQSGDRCVAAWQPHTESRRIQCVNRVDAGVRLAEGFARPSRTRTA